MVEIFLEIFGEILGHALFEGVGYLLLALVRTAMEWIREIWKFIT